MTKAIHGEFEINTKKVLKLLVSNLYGDDPHLTIRELLQNAHDAIKILHNPRNAEIIVRINPFGEERYIEITDTGCGMDLQDIQQQLCVVGESDKLIAAREKPEIIGRFGIGFLSSFIVADRLEVRTKKANTTTEKCYLFKADSGTGYTVEEVRHLAFNHGTSVKLFLKQDRDYPQGVRDLIYELMTSDGMERVLIDCGYFLEFPVRLTIGADERGRTVNARNLPWEGGQFVMDAYKTLFSRDEPLFTYPFKPTKPGEIEAYGVFYFSSELLSRPSVRLYSKRLLVNPEDPDLLPQYGGFSYCIIECPSLDLDLSRRGASKSDPTYKALRKVVREKFTDAFYKFATQMPDTLVSLWPSVDNRIISALLKVADDKNPRFIEDQEIAEDFLVRCGPHIPFLILDHISGGQGIPVWKSINVLCEHIEDRNNDGKIIVPFTEAKSPVEKDMLIEQHSELIDAGRADKAHDMLLRRLVTVNERFDSFELRAVAISQFQPIQDDEIDQWKALVNDTERGVTFYQRSHDVVVEYFSPFSTPVMITASTVSGDVIEALREQFGKLAGASADHALLMTQLQQHLDRMGSKGGLITIHINASNALMQRLSDAYNNSITRKAASQGAMNVVWRAVVDFYGVGATRDMLARDRRNTEDLLEVVLDKASELHEQQEMTRKVKEELKTLQEKVSLLKPSTIGELTACDLFVGVIDISNSTRDLMGNPNCSPEDKALFLQQVLHSLASQIDGFARVVGFTGDGLQFYIDPESPTATSVGSQIQSLSIDLGRIISANDKLLALRKRLGITEIPLRIAIDYGQVFVGEIGRYEEAFGLPFVQATRVSSDNDLYEQHHTSILLTAQAYDNGAQRQFWNARQFNEAGSLEAMGLSQPIEVFKLRG